MTDDTIIEFPLPDQNIVQNFVLDSSSIRGRVVRLNTVLNDIITPHDLPVPVENLMAETIILASVLSSMLKYDGVFILQMQGAGALGMLVCDINSDGHARACCSLNDEKYKELLKDRSESELTLKDLLGKGHLAFTVDQGANTDRYQGIVALEGQNLEECIQHYFEQSEQIETVIRLAVEKQKNGRWSAGSLMLQRMPLDGGDLQNEVKEKAEEDWVRSSILLKTCSDEELLDEKLHENTLLLRLFHEEGVRVLDSSTVTAQCRCSEDRLLGVLATMPKDDIDHIKDDDGKISMTCEFCKTEYAIMAPDE